jgi:hypothetical protein
LHAAFLASLLKVHEGGGGGGASIVIPATKFEDTFSAYLTMMNGLESLFKLGVEGVDTGPFSTCPFCTKDFTDLEGRAHALRR